jgi:hypothetical protein
MIVRPPHHPIFVRRADPVPSLVDHLRIDAIDILAVTGRVA